jgi:ornithine carbamoyltransferase
MTDLVMIRTFEQAKIERFARALARARHQRPDQRVPPLPDPGRHLHLHRAPRLHPGKTVAWVGDGNNMANTWLQAADCWASRCT